MTSEKSVRVYVENVPYQADEPYEYALPPSLEEIVCVGSLVCCPFGRGSRTVRAIVVSVGAETQRGRRRLRNRARSRRKTASALLVYEGALFLHVF